MHCSGKTAEPASSACAWARAGAGAEKWNGAEDRARLYVFGTPHERDARIVRAQKQLAFAGAREPFGEMLVHAERAAAHLGEHVSESQHRDIEENPHCVRPH